jgi:hypothetical protein
MGRGRSYHDAAAASPEPLPGKVLQQVLPMSKPGTGYEWVTQVQGESLGYHMVAVGPVDFHSLHESVVE